MLQYHHSSRFIVYSYTVRYDCSISCIGVYQVLYGWPLFKCSAWIHLTAIYQSIESCRYLLGGKCNHNVDPCSLYMNSREIEEEWKPCGSTSGYPQVLNRIERDPIPNIMQWPGVKSK